MSAQRETSAGHEHVDLLANPHPLKRKGDAAFKGKRYTEAIEAYTQLLAEDPAEVVCWLNVGAAYVARREWDKAREACETYLRQAPENPETAPLRAKAHFRMALACFELSVKDTTAFGPAIYLRSALRDAERSWSLAVDSAALRQPIADLLQRARQHLKRQQHALAHQQPAEVAQSPLVPVRHLQILSLLQDDTGLSPDDDLQLWGLKWLRAPLQTLLPAGATPESPRIADVVDLLARTCAHSPSVLLEILQQGMKECCLIQAQLQVTLSLLCGAWDTSLRTALSRENWLLPPHCIGRFTAPIDLLCESFPTGHRVVLVLARGLVATPFDMDGNPGDAEVIQAWLTSQPTEVVSMYDSISLEPGPPCTLHVELPRYEVVTGCCANVYVFDTTDTALLSHPLPASALRDPSRPPIAPAISNPPH